MKVLLVIIYVLSFIASSIVVNKAQQMYMKFIGASGMFFDGKKKLFAIVLIGFIFAGLAMKAFGIG